MLLLPSKIVGGRTEEMDELENVEEDHSSTCIFVDR